MRHTSWFSVLYTFLISLCSSVYGKISSVVFLLSLISLLFVPEVFSAQTTLTWNAPTTNADGTPITYFEGSYRIYYGTASGNYSYVINLSSPNSVVTYTISDLTAGQTYFFAATAINTFDNESDFSAEVSKTIASLPPVSLSVNRTGPGTVTGPSINCGSTCAATYNPGTVITLYAVPALDASFSGWSGGGCSGTGACVTTMNTNTFIAAPFITYALPPIAAFSGSPRSGQAPLYVVFADSSANSPTSWNWNFGDGRTDSLQNPGHAYQTVGSYTVSLTTSNSAGLNTVSNTNFITVTSCPNQRVRIARTTPVYYSTHQSAYNSASNGDTIQSQAFDFTEDLNFNRNIAVTLKGGYNCWYNSNPPSSTLTGSLTISSGTVTVENLIIQ